MSNALKCPNPTCPYLFDPTRVPTGVVLTCPRCGMRFTLGPPLPAPGIAAGTAYSLPGRYAVQAGTDLATVAAPAQERPQRRSFSAAGNSGPFQTAVLVFVSLVLMGGVAAMVYLRLASKPRARLDAAARLREHNLSFEPPENPWAQDDDLRARLGSPMILAYKRTDPEAYMAFGARDYDTREPRLSELRDGLNRPLNNLFEDIRPTEIANATWLGLPVASAFTFRAQTKDGSTVRGLCFAVNYKGIGYWSIAWSAENEAGKQEAAFESTRGKMKLLDLRENWVAKELPVRPIGGHALRYRVLDSEDIWKEPDSKERTATDVDPKGDLLLTARVKQKGRDFHEEATLVVLILEDGGGDPLAQGRKYVEDQWTADVKEGSANVTPKFIDRSGPPEGDPAPNTVDVTAPVVRLQMSVPGASSSSKLLVVSAIRLESKVVVVQAWCAWGDRAAFESRLVQIAGSLRESR